MVGLLNGFIGFNGFNGFRGFRGFNRIGHDNGG
jgi:hypothetical protein